MSIVEIALDELRELILKLDATGNDGFEGLMAVVLTAVIKTSFNVAKSGSQRGRDGQSAFDSGCVRFECKLYDATISKNADSA